MRVHSFRSMLPFSSLWVLDVGDDWGSGEGGLEAGIGSVCAESGEVMITSNDINSSVFLSSFLIYRSALALVNTYIFRSQYVGRSCCPADDLPSRHIGNRLAELGGFSINGLTKYPS